MSESTGSFGLEGGASRALEARAADAVRLEWPDVARGVGIVLVVAGHSLGGMRSSGQITPMSPLDLAFSAIYTFHMPLFFILSGMFVTDRLAKPAANFVAATLTRIALPYLVWSVIQLAVIAALGSIVNAPQIASPMLFVSVLWSPPSQYWFLFVLFWFQLAALGFARAWTLNGMVAAAAVARILPEVVELPAIVDAGARYWIFFALATRFAYELRDWKGIGTPASLTLPALGLAWALSAWLSIATGGYLSLWNLPAAAFGVLFVFTLSRIEGLTGASVLAALGRRSMPIFLTHVLIVAGVRIVMVSIFKITDPLLIAPVAITAGVVAPVLVFDLLDRRGLARYAALK